MTVVNRGVKVNDTATSLSRPGTPGHAAGGWSVRLNRGGRVSAVMGASVSAVRGASVQPASLGPDDQAAAAKPARRAPRF